MGIFIMNSLPHDHDIFVYQENHHEASNSTAQSIAYRNSPSIEVRHKLRCKNMKDDLAPAQLVIRPLCVWLRGDYQLLITGFQEINYVPSQCNSLLPVYSSADV